MNELHEVHELSESRRELLDSIAREFLHNSPGGRRLLAVEGATDEAATRFADDLAAALSDHGQPVLRQSLGDVDERTLRSATVEPFRARTLPGAEHDDTVLVVDGRRLLNQSVRGIWHFTVWILAGDELPHASVNVVVDATDESAPKRYFYDLCKLPPSFGERRAAAASVTTARPS
ncbi:hypothetical protein [Agromyces ramosus]|uniref:Uridine kinase n=1 Tax=Agromyces ramosus TaxID=33879 RepID=A0ABU0R6W5_9MICO|nr:hypothetical protein [Agromyces ramosus]MDQ0893826.1 hypothetical protein [Agromyces ramosus]